MSATAEAGQSDAAAADVRQMLLPDAGEGLTEAEIIAWRVGPGDEVTDGDVVVEVETAKAIVELPCPFSGRVAEVLAAVGDTVAVGAPILAVAAAGGGLAPAADSAADAPPVPPAEAGAHPGSQAASGAGRQAVLVGYGPRSGEGRRRRRLGKGRSRGRGAEPSTAPAAAPPARAGESVAAPTQRAAAVAAPGPAGPPAADLPVGPAAARRVLAKPPVRKLARDLGVELATLTPTGPGGVVTRDDVLAARESPAHAGPTGGGVATGTAADAGEDQERRVPVRGVRRATAEAMVTSAFTAPHVTEWVQVDVTEAMALLERLRQRREYRDLRLTPLSLLARAICLAVRRTPETNSSWDGEAGEIVVHPRVNLGIATATDRGLVVPVLPAAERLDLAGLTRGVGELVDTARAGRLTPAQLSGGTLSITNVGVFGVDGGTPILPPGQTTIVCLGQVRRLPWVVEEQVVPRSVVTVAVSFDHRVIDGESGSRFLADVAALLADPGLALAWG